MILALMISVSGAYGANAVFSDEPVAAEVSETVGKQVGEPIEVEIGEAEVLERSTGQ